MSTAGTGAVSMLRRLTPALLLLCALTALAMVVSRPMLPEHPLSGFIPAWRGGERVNRKSAVTTEATDIAVGPETVRTGVEHFGINLSGQTFYDSGQMLKNLVFRNPGFEGETWQSNLRCKAVTVSSCTDENSDSVWPDGFLAGAHYEMLSGAAKGFTGTIETSSAAGSGRGVTLTFAVPPHGLAPGDFVLVSMMKPGNAAAGWWTNTQGGATLSTELHDLSPETPGRQALRVSALGPEQFAGVNSYFDSTPGHSFVRLRGRYAVNFRARLVSGRPVLPVSVARGPQVYLQKNVGLTSVWHDYNLPFTVNEDDLALGTVGLSFAVSQSTVLLDDVELVPLGGSSANPTAFRDEVVDALQQLQPGILRFMDNGISFGSTLDDLLAPPFARRRGGVLVASAESQDIPIGLHESLVLAHTAGADPWYTLPATLSPDEAQNVIEYLAGPASSPYGSKRAALGQNAPWTSAFRTIHLEFGNEMWGGNPGSAINDPAVYGARATSLFNAARSSPWFQNASFDLIVNGQGPNIWWTNEMLKASSAHDTIDFAPYLFGQFNDASSTEAIFGAMFAEPEQMETTGYMAKQMKLTAKAPSTTAVAVYETNLGTGGSSNNSVSQADLNRTIPSVGAAVAVADHMLLMLRELGITKQCLFALPEFADPFVQPDDTSKTVALWGSVVDMGGETNLRRPTYLALQMMNRALLPKELATHLTGANPTWTQAASQNDGVGASQPHLLQTFAFSDGGTHRTMILINLSRTASLPVTFSGPGHPVDTVTESRLTSAQITDSNEASAKVAIARRSLGRFDPAEVYSLPPFSMTVLDWQVRP